MTQLTLFYLVPPFSLVIGTEIIMENFPESVIQTITMVIIPYDNITDTQKFGLVSTFLSAGLILTDACFGMEKTQALTSPRCPVYGLIPKEKNQQRRCKAGFFLFNATFIYTSVFSHAMLYLHSGSFRYSGYQIAVETAVVCSIKAWEGELFALATVLPSAYDVVLGPLMKFIYVYYNVYSYSSKRSL